MLMEQAREFATSAGAFRLELQTARSNDNAQRLYESLGWVRDDVYLVYTLRL
jgi:ribosomal protein S18 acetylase RimI-like enzyme